MCTPHAPSTQHTRRSTQHAAHTTQHAACRTYGLTRARLDSRCTSRLSLHRNYIHVLYKKENFIKLESDAVDGIKSWRLTEGGTDPSATARAGAGGGLGYSFRSQPHVCFCGEATPCKHVDFTGKPSPHNVRWHGALSTRPRAHTAARTHVQCTNW